MKTKVALITLLSVVLVNCGKKSDPAPETAPTVSPDAPVVVIPPGSSPYTPPVTDPGFNFGGTTNFVFDSKGVYQQYTLRYIPDLSVLQNVKINVNLDKYNNKYGGTITIRYTLYGQTYEGFFTSGNTAQTNKYNVWFTPVTNKVFHGFFEDYRGGLILVIDDTSSFNDGVSSTDTVSGSVWFKNFGNTPNPHPATYCWFVVGGPYDCRAWKTSDGVNTTLGVNPDAGYTRLGTFTGLPALKAFNAITL